MNLPPASIARPRRCCERIEARFQTCSPAPIRGKLNEPERAADILPADPRHPVVAQRSSGAVVWESVDEDADGSGVLDSSKPYALAGSHHTRTLQPDPRPPEHVTLAPRLRPALDFPDRDFLLAARSAHECQADICLTRRDGRHWPDQVQDSACQQDAPDRAGPENHREKHIREPSRAIGQRRASPAPPLPPPLVRTSREREGRRPSSTPMVEMAARGSCTDCKVRLT